MKLRKQQKLVASATHKAKHFSTCYLQKLMNRYCVAIGGNEICTLRSILSTSNPSLAILIGNFCLCIFTSGFPLWMSLYHIISNQLLHSIISYMGLVEEVAALGMFVCKTDYPISSQKLFLSMGRKFFYRLPACFSLWFVERSHMLRCDIYSIYICVCVIQIMYTQYLRF